MPLSALQPSDALAAATHPDPTSLYTRLASEQPLLWDAEGARWIVSSAEAVRSALLHPALRVRPPGAPVPPQLMGTALGDLFARLIRMRDGEAREPLRRAISAALAGLPQDEVHSLAQACAETLLPSSPQTGEQVTAFTFALPLRAVAQLLGIASDTLPSAVRAAQQLALALSPLASPEEREVGVHALSVLDAALVSASDAPLPDALHGAAEAMELRANAIGLLVQTCEATAGLIGNALVALGRDPAVREGLQLDALLDAVLRDDPPVQNTRRWAAQDLVLQGTRVAAGQELLLLLAATRCPHLAFGHGAHACPGAALARALAQVALARLLAVGLEPETLAGRFVYRRSLNGRIPLFSGRIGGAR